MSNSGHTHPYPWELDTGTAEIIVQIFPAKTGLPIIATCETKEDAERIILCVNACRELSNEHLEDDAVVKLKQDRDQLQAQLKQAQQALEFLQEAHKKLREERDHLAKLPAPLLVLLKAHKEQMIKNGTSRRHPKPFNNVCEAIKRLEGGEW